MTVAKQLTPEMEQTLRLEAAFDAYATVLAVRQCEGGGGHEFSKAPGPDPIGSRTCVYCGTYEEVPTVSATVDFLDDGGNVIEVGCAWFALCDNAATRVREHPVLGSVPICARCDDKVDAL